MMAEKTVLGTTIRDNLMSRVLGPGSGLYGPLCLISSDGWDSVGSLSISRNMANRSSEEATSQSSDAVENFAQIAYIFWSVED